MKDCDLKFRDLCLGVVVATAMLANSSAVASSPRFQVVYNFKGGNDGIAPVASMVSDASGILYGVTSEGGGGSLCGNGQAVGCGTVFSLTPPLVWGGAWKETILYAFSGGSDGSTPLGNLTLDSSGNLYGTTNQGGDLTNSLCISGNTHLGCGVVFEISPPLSPGGIWTETLLYTFEGIEGAYPEAGLVLDPMGNLYGTTSVGGGVPTCANGFLIGCGTVFELSSSNQGHTWTEQNLYAFSGGADGSNPLSDLIFNRGALYGTTYSGGTGGGVAFTLALSGAVWTESVIYTFASGNPRAGLTVGPNGYFYGTASTGGGGNECSGGCGFAFALQPSQSGSWNESTLYAFGQSHSAIPYARVIFDAKGDAYGTTFGNPRLSCGSIYRLQPATGGTWREAEYPFFPGRGSPCAPEDGLIFGQFGALYGASSAGGSCVRKNGCGSVFAILP